MKCISAIFLCITASSSWAATFTIEGQLLDGGSAASGSYPTTIDVLDAGNGSLWSEAVDLIIVAGNFSIEVGSVVPVPDEALLAGRFVRFVIDGESLSPMPLPTSTRASAVERAARARVADAAGSLFGNDAATRLLQQNIASAQVAFANIANLPAGLVDGDQGTTMSVTAPLALSGGTLSLGPLGTANISDASVTPGVLATGVNAAVTGAVTAAVTGRVVIDGTITTAMANGLTAADVNDGSTLYSTVNQECGQAVGTLTTSPFCDRNCSRGCGFLEFAMLNCDNVIDADDPCICVSALVGQEPAACRHTAIGRLVQ